jgi:hypothetical protein
VLLRIFEREKMEKERRRNPVLASVGLVYLALQTEPKRSDQILDYVTYEANEDLQIDHHLLCQSEPPKRLDGRI